MVPVWSAQNSLLCWLVMLITPHVYWVPTSPLYPTYFIQPQQIHLQHSSYTYGSQNMGEEGGWKTGRLRGPESLLWDQSSTYNREATLIKFQQYSCRKKTNTMTSPVDVQMGWRILQGPTSRCRASGSKWLLRGRAGILLQGHVPSI